MREESLACLRIRTSWFSDIRNLFPTNVAGPDFAVGSLQIRVTLRIFFLAVTFQKMFTSAL